MILWQVRYEAINLFGQNLLNYYFLAMAFVSSLISSLIRKCWDFFFFFSFCRFPSTWCKTTQCYFLLLLFFLVSFLFEQCVCQRIFSRTAEVVWSFAQHVMQNTLVCRCCCCCSLFLFCFNNVFAKEYFLELQKLFGRFPST